MKRRTFLRDTSIAGAAGALTGIIHSADVSGEKKEQSFQDSNRRPSNNPGLLLSLKGEYYRHYPVDFSRGTEGALGFKGWGESVQIEAPADETALILMHVWNVGISPDLPFTSDGPAGGVMDMLEWASRSAPIIRKTLPLLLEAARKAGIPVIHVASDERYASRYPGWKITKKIAEPEPPPVSGAIRNENFRSPDDRKNALIFGERFGEHISYYASKIDIPDEAKPLDTEPVVTTTHQFNAVLRHLGVWQLIYSGFAINWCLWFSPGGMCDMSRLGYRCSCIRDGVTAVENKESARGEFNKQQALWRTSLMFGYIHSADDFIRACGKLAG